MKTIKAILVCLSLPCLASAYTNDDQAKTAVSDGSQSDTQAALNYIDGKNQDGWTLTVGASGGSYTWTAAVEMNPTFIHSITIQGGGTGSSRPIITANFTSSGEAFGIRASDNKLCRVTQFVFRVASGKTLGTGFICVLPTTTATMRNSFRIDNCRFEDCQNIAIGVMYPNISNAGAIYGVVDSCDFAITSGANGLYIYSGANGNNWVTSGTSGGNMTWGTADTVCVEDCTFTNSGSTVPGRPAIDASYFGARYMMRHCSFTNWVCVAHGADSAPTSTLQVEMLHNTWVIKDAVDFIMYLRGGSMRFWDNTVILQGSASWLNQIVKTAIDPIDPTKPTFQQIGHGVVNGVETLVPVYVWGNSTPSNVPLVNAPNNNPSLWVQGVQYFLTNPGNYTELAYPHPLRNASSSAPLAPSSLGATAP